MVRADGGWREARTPQADACKDEQQSQAPGWACQRVRSALTKTVSFDEDRKLSVRGLALDATSGQLRFLGSIHKPLGQAVAVMILYKNTVFDLPCAH